jgi:hypothetical protein
MLCLRAPRRLRWFSNGLGYGGQKPADTPRMPGSGRAARKIDRILDLASRYPSAGCAEPQEFIMVRGQRVRDLGVGRA